MIKIKPPLYSAKGFTLVELMIVTGLSVVLLLTATTVFITFLLSSSKTGVRQTLKNEGDFALSKITFLLRNSLVAGYDIPATQAVEAVCDKSNLGSITYKNIDDEYATIGLDSDLGQLALDRNGSTELLTSTSVEASGLQFVCHLGADGSSRYVSIEFELSKESPKAQEGTEDLVEKFKTGVSLRN